MKIERRQFSVDATGGIRWGIVITPDNVGLTEKCALWIFNHGTGEAGDGTINTLDVLYNNGCPLDVARKQEMKFINPITKQETKIIVVGLQGTRGWCCQSEQIDYVLKNDILKKYPVDPAAVTISGLSAGGEETWEAITYPDSALYSFAVPMSAAQIDFAKADFNRIVANGIRIWAFHGLLDSGLTDEYNTIQYIGKVDAIKKGLTHATYPNVGHGGWATNYSPTYKESFIYDWDNNGKPYSKQLNIYEVSLACTKGSSFLFEPQSSSPNPPTMSITKSVLTATVNNNIVTLDGTASIGNGQIRSWSFRVAADSQMKSASFENGPDGYLSRGDKLIKNATGLNGDYIFELIINDQYGGSSIGRVSVTIGTVTQPPTPPIKTVKFSVILDGKTYTIYSDDSLGVA